MTAIEELNKIFDHLPDETLVALVRIMPKEGCSINSEEKGKWLEGNVTQLKSSLTGLVEWRCL